MKKSITRIVSVAVLTTVALLAQGPRPENGMGGGGGGTNPPANPPTVATIVAHEVSFLTTLLTLTTGQATQATTIFTTALTSIDTLQTQITTAQTALATAIKANATTTSPRVIPSDRRPDTCRTSAPHMGDETGAARLHARTRATADPVRFRARSDRL